MSIASVLFIVKEEEIEKKKKCFTYIHSGPKFSI